jgi:hypothetical protein
MYPTSGAALRGDINAVVEQASAADKFFIADLVLPFVPVPARSGQYPVIQIAAGELLTPIATERKSTGSYGEVHRAITSDTYDCIDRGLEEAVGDTDAADYARYFAMESTAARLTLRNIKLAREVRVAAALMNASTFTNATNSAVAYTEGNIATIDFVRDVKAAVARVNGFGVVANTIIVSKTVADRLTRSTLLQNYMRGTFPSNVQFSANAQTLKQLFADDGIENVYVPRSVYNSAKKGQAFVSADIWGTTYVWVGAVKPARSPEAMVEGGCGYTLHWNAEGGVYVTETYRNEQRRSNMVRVRQNNVEKIVDASAVTLITTQWS